MTEGTNSVKMHSYTQKAFVFIKKTPLLDKYKKVTESVHHLWGNRLPATDSVQETGAVDTRIHYKIPLWRIGFNFCNYFDSICEVSVKWNVCVVQLNTIYIPI